MRILYVTTIGITMNFFNSFVKLLIDEGHTVDIATNEITSKVPDCYREWGCTVYQIETSRSPLDRNNLIAVRQIKKLTEENRYDIVHCHTPVAAMCTRIACRGVRKKGTKVFYTAHGFHFYKGAPLKNRLIYYSVEKLCSYFTDVLITINQEDYALAKKKMKANQVVYVPGVGIDLDKFGKTTVKKEEKRRELGIPENAKWILNVGELIPRKNQETLIRAVAKINDLYLTIAGCGELKDFLTGLIGELGVSDRIMLIGYRTDISELCNSCDAFAFSSFHEGLPVSVMEAMASGLPVVCSRIRGNIDLIDENGGELFDPNSVEDCRNAILRLLNRDTQEMSEYNLKRIEEFEINNVNKIMKELDFDFLHL